MKIKNINFKLLTILKYATHIFEVALDDENR